MALFLVISPEAGALERCQCSDDDAKISISMKAFISCVPKVAYSLTELSI